MLRKVSRVTAEGKLGFGRCADALEFLFGLGEDYLLSESGVTNGGQLYIVLMEKGREYLISCLIEMWTLCLTHLLRFVSLARARASLSKTTAEGNSD